VVTFFRKRKFWFISFFILAVIAAYGIYRINDNKWSLEKPKNRFEFIPEPKTDFINISIDSTNNDQDFYSFILNDVDNHPHNFSDLKKYKATAIIFLLVDCPASQSYSLTLNNLKKKYPQVNLIGIFPGKYSTEEEMRNFRDTYHITFPLLKDPDSKLVHYLHAIVAPQCFLIDQNANVVYEGRIDDWMYGVGKKKTTVTEHNLEDAMKAVIAGTPVKVKVTKAFGCFIEND
jgi:peroxiredoxin